jgi:drug/metabolite transporter (DMT)-like permease
MGYHPQGMSMDYIGEIAALLTSFLFTITAVVFTQASHQVGSMIVNRVRLVIALLYLMLINLVLFSQPLPIASGGDRWLWLGLSGVVGLALGDMFLFRAFEYVGARMAMLMMSLAPVIGAVIAWLALGETLRLGQIAGIALTLAGIAWVVATRPADSPVRSRLAGLGVLFGLLAAIGQAVGLVLSKQGMADGFSPFAANTIRMLTAAVVFWLVTFVQRQSRVTIQAVRTRPSALKLLALGSLVGPVLGVSASLLAVQHAAVGVASTLMALPPVFLLPIGHFFFKERFGWQTVAGTFVAIAGVALLFLV